MWQDGGSLSKPWKQVHAVSQPPPLPETVESSGRGGSLQFQPTWVPVPGAPPPAPPPPPVIPPRYGATTEAVNPEPPVVFAGKAAEWRDISSMVVSTLIHAAVLLILALLVPSLKDDGRSPVVIIDSALDEPMLDPETLDVPPLELPLPPLDEIDQPLPEAATDLPEIEVSDVANAAVDLVDPAAGFAGPLDEAVAGSDALLADLASTQAGGGPGGNGGFGGEIGRRLAQAGAQSGAIQVSLAWNNFNDIDLHVITPFGERIFFNNRQSRCRGHLDVDMNAMGPVSREAVENIYWRQRAAPRGTFTVHVHHYARHDTVDETPFEVHVLVDGTTRSYKGIVRSGMPPLQVAEFHRAANPGQDSSEEEFPE